MNSEIARLHAVVSADTDRAEQNLRDFKGGLSGAAREAQSAGGRFSGLSRVAGALGGVLGGIAVADVASQLYQMGDAGLRAERGLVAVTGSAEAADAAIAAMKSATGGLLTETDAAAAATRLMSLGIANNAQELEEFTRVASTLGAVIGQDVTTSVEQLSLAIANMSYERLDALGISAGAVRERVRELKEEGIATEEAFRLATLEEANIKLEALEEAGFEAGTSLDRLKVMAVDSATALGENLATGILKVTDAIEENWESIEALGNALDGMQTDAAEAATAFQEGQAAYYEHAAAVEFAANADALLQTAIANVSAEMNALPLGETQSEMYLVADAFIEGARAAGYTDLQIIALWESTGGLRDELGNLYANSTSIPPAMAAIEGSAYGAAGGMNTAAAATRNFKDAIDELNNARTGNAGRNSATATNLPMDARSFRERRDSAEVVAMGISPTASATTAFELDIQARRFEAQAREAAAASAASVRYRGGGGGGGARSAGAAIGRGVTREIEEGFADELRTSDAAGIEEAVKDWITDQKNIDAIREDLVQSLGDSMGATAGQIDLALTDLFGLKATPIDTLIDSMTDAVNTNQQALRDAGAAVGEHIETGLESRFAGIGDRIVERVLDALAEAA